MIFCELFFLVFFHFVFAKLCGKLGNLLWLCHIRLSGDVRENLSPEQLELAHVSPRLWLKFLAKFLGKKLFHTHTAAATFFTSPLYTNTRLSEKFFPSSRIFRTFSRSAECWSGWLLDGPEAESNR